MYLALARKYRPQNFSEVIGQDAVIKTLSNAISLDRIHHAYLFCGARGVGKTSLARIFAKSVNCEKGSGPAPCQTCASCEGITRGNAMDVIEIDAASNTSVEDARDIIEQVKYLPGASRYKIYIIDEVHMLSKSAFNALLKTLEEPPAHVLFVLATTDPHKLPVTILSRCQRLDFRKMAKPVLSAHLKKVLSGESVRAEDAAVDLIAECAGGSVRDALSLLDQAISAQGQDLSEAGVRSVLGLSERLLLQNAFKNAVTGRLEASLQDLKDADAEGLDLKLFGEDLLGYFRHLVVTLSTGKVPEEVSPSEQDYFKALSAECELSLVLAQYQILFQGVAELARTEFQKTSLEITFVKLSRAADMLSLSELVIELKERAERKDAGKPAVPLRSAPQAPPRPSFEQRPAPASSGSAAVAMVAPAPMPAPQTGTDPDWYEVAALLQKAKPQLGGLLGEAVPVTTSSTRIEIGYPASSPSKALLIERRGVVEDWLNAHFGRKVDFVVSELSDEKKKP